MSSYATQLGMLVQISLIILALCTLHTPMSVAAYIPPPSLNKAAKGATHQSTTLYQPSTLPLTRLFAKSTSKKASKSNGSKGKSAKSSNSSSTTDNSSALDWTDMNQRVLANAQADLDWQRLGQALEARKVEVTKNDLLYAQEALSNNRPVSPWKIAIAAASVSSATSLFLFQNFYVAAIVLLVVFIAASRDPIEESAEDVTGALARTVGRVTIDSIEGSQPKIRALARAIISGEEEINALRSQVEDLERENKELALWKERKIKVDEVSGDYKINDLKAMLKKENLPTTGTKVDLLMRLMEENIMNP
jgi:hypothetical protein